MLNLGDVEALNRVCGVRDRQRSLGGVCGTEASRWLTVSKPPRWNWAAELPRGPRGAGWVVGGVPGPAIVTGAVGQFVTSSSS